jgi:phosphopantetheine--protein transferase-like protein
MLESLLPPGVHAVEGPILLEDWDVTPEEMARTDSHVPHRKAEFLTGRTYARRALRSLGLAAPTIGSHPDRSPIWPEGVVGCITHTRDYCAVVAAKTPGIRGLGVDIEIPGRMNEAMARKTFTEAEQAYLAAQPGSLRQERMCVIFCAKEAFYKMQFPLTKAWVGFQDVEVRLEEEGRFSMTLEKAVAPGFEKGSVLAGVYRLDEGLAAALIAV